MGGRVEECRRLTPEELEQLAPHMRREQVYEGRVLPYRLAVAIDGESRVAELVRGAAARADRPLYVFRELSVSPGTHSLAISFTREGELPARAAEPVTPERLELSAGLELRSKEVVLVTYDPEDRRLVLKGHAR